MPSLIFRSIPSRRFRSSFKRGTGGGARGGQGNLGLQRLEGVPKPAWPFPITFGFEPRGDIPRSRVSERSGRAAIPKHGAYFFVRRTCRLSRNVITGHFGERPCNARLSIFIKEAR